MIPNEKVSKSSSYIGPDVIPSGSRDQDCCDHEAVRRKESVTFRRQKFLADARTRDLVHKLESSSFRKSSVASMNPFSASDHDHKQSSDKLRTRMHAEKAGSVNSNNIEGEEPNLFLNLPLADSQMVTAFNANGDRISFMDRSGTERQRPSLLFGLDQTRTNVNASKASFIEENNTEREGPSLSIFPDQTRTYINSSRDIVSSMNKNKLFLDLDQMGTDLKAVRGRASFVDKNSPDRGRANVLLDLPAGNDQVGTATFMENGINTIVPDLPFRPPPGMLCIENGAANKHVPQGNTLVNDGTVLNGHVQIHQTLKPTIGRQALDSEFQANSCNGHPSLEGCNISNYNFNRLRRHTTNHLDSNLPAQIQSFSRLTSDEIDNNTAYKNRSRSRAMKHHEDNRNSSRNLYPGKEQAGTDVCGSNLLCEATNHQPGFYEMSREDTTRPLRSLQSSTESDSLRILDRQGSLENSNSNKPQVLDSGLDVQEVYLYCLPDDEVPEKRDYHDRKLHYNDQRYRSQSRGRSDSSFQLSPIFPAKGHLVTKRMGTMNGSLDTCKGRLSP